MAEQFNGGANRQCMQNSLSRRSTQFASQIRHRSRAKGEWRSDSRHQRFFMGHIFCPVQAAFAGIAAGGRCPSRPDPLHAVRTEMGRPTVAFYYTPAFSDSCHLPACLNQSPLKSRKPITTHINHSPWILTSIGLTSIGPSLTRATWA